MKVYVEDKTLIVPDELIPRTKKIKEKTPQIAFLSSPVHFSDIKKEMGALKYICQYIRNNYEIENISDLMAGCGFSGKVFSKYLSRDILFNDLDPLCFSVLKKNYSKKCFNKDIFELTPDFYKDLSFIDFNTFTIQHLSKWNILFKKAHQRSKLLLITDSACYGFKFGNLKRYGCKTALEYYLKVKEVMKIENKWELIKIVDFGSAALLLFDTKGKKELNIETASALFISKNVKTLQLNFKEN